MKKIFLTAIAVITVILDSFATNTIKENAEPVDTIDLLSEIVGEGNSNTTLLVVAYRQQALSQIENRDYSKLVSIIENSESKIDTSKTIVFFPYEKALMCLLANDIDKLFEVFGNFKYNVYAETPSAIVISDEAEAIIKDNAEQWIEWYNNLEYSDEERRSIRLLLGAAGLFEDNYQNQKEARILIRKYPESKFKGYAKSLKNSFISASWDFALGAGVNNLNGDISNLVDPSTMFNLETGFFLNRFYLAVSIQPSAAKIKLPTVVIPEDDYLNSFFLEEGDKLSLTNVKFKFGWMVFHNEWMRVYPTFNISGHSVSVPTKDDRNEDPIKINSCTGVGAGINADFGIINWVTKDALFKSHIGIRININGESYIADDNSLGGYGMPCSASLIWWVE